MSNVRWARIGYSLVAWLFAVAAVIQIYLAGEAVFADLTRPGNFELHRNVGYGIGILGLILLVLAFAAKMPLRVVAATALLLVLMVLQSVLVFMKTDQPNIAALHPVVGFLIVLLAVWIAWHTLRYIRAPLPVGPERPAAVPAPANGPAAPVPHEPKEDDQI